MVKEYYEVSNPWFKYPKLTCFNPKVFFEFKIFVCLNNNVSILIGLVSWFKRGDKIPRSTSLKAK